MTTEEDFQTLLDKDITDYTTRLIFADWLDEIGDKRAAGYRKMGELQLAPFVYDMNRGLSSNNYLWVWVRNGKSSTKHYLNYKWYNKLSNQPFLHDGSSDYYSRRQAEDEAAIAYYKMENPNG